MFRVSEVPEMRPPESNDLQCHDAGSYWTDGGRQADSRHFLRAFPRNPERLKVASQHRSLARVQLREKRIVFLLVHLTRGIELPSVFEMSRVRFSANEFKK